MVKVGLDESNNWIELEKGTRAGLYLDGYLKQNLDTAKTIIKKDWDMIFVFDGYEGTGKSVMCMQTAFYCDPTLTIDRITFNPDDFEKAILSAEKYQAIVLDEAYSGLSSRGAMSSINKKIVQMLTVIREKNLFIFIVLPSFFDLDKYVAVWRSRALIHVYSEKDFQRGFFKFFNTERKKNLYMLGKKFYSYKVQSPNFSGRFANMYVVDEEEYRKKKRSTAMKPDDFNKSFLMSTARKVKTEIAKNLKDKSLGLTNVQVSEIMGVTTMTIHNYLKKYEEEGENTPKIL